MLKIAICDDEDTFVQRLEKQIAGYLDKMGEVYSIEKFLSGVEFTKLGAKMAGFRIVFLDINMAEMDGLETARKIRELSEETFVVFVTAFINYTLEGYKVNAFRYLLKNSVNFNEALEECMDSIFQKLSIASTTKTYRFVEGERQFFLKRLMYIESNLHKLEFHMIEDGPATYTMQGILNVIEKDIADQNFLRIHQSFLVNLAFVEALGDRTMLLVDGTTLPIAKLRYKDAVNAYVRYRGLLL